MTDENKPQQPYRPPVRGQNRYAGFKDIKKEIAAAPQEEGQPTRQELFQMNIIAATEKGGTMEQGEEDRFLIDLVFKPAEPGLKLRPEETQLLLAYMSEILRAAGEAEQAEEIKQTHIAEQEAMPCK